MSNTSKHALCAVLSAVLAVIGMAVLIEISTGLFGVTLPLEPIYDQVAGMVKTVALMLWSLRYVFIVIAAFWSVFAPPGSDPLFLLMIFVTSAAIFGNVMALPRIPGVIFPSFNDLLNVIGLPIATVIVALITAGLILRSIRCARSVWIG